MRPQLILTWVFALSIWTGVFSQAWNVDSLARSIPGTVTKSPEKFARFLADHFPEETDRVRALYSWLAVNISYDNSQAETLGQFESTDDFVRYTLNTKRAVCQGYAEVFTALCSRMGIQALTVHGYNRINGDLKSDMGHAWNLAKMNGKWYLFDPTWGSGYIERGSYRKHFSGFYFMAPPDSLILSHMPFDPIWQLLEFPVSHDQFIDGGGAGDTYCNFSDSLDIYYHLDEVSRAESTLRRAEATHAGRREIGKMYRKYTDYVSTMKCNMEITRYNESSLSLTRAIDKFNEYQALRDKRNIASGQLRSLLLSSGDLAGQSLRQAQEISPCRSLSPQEIQELIKHIDHLANAISSASETL